MHNQNYLETGYSVTETRILFEFNRQEGFFRKTDLQFFESSTTDKRENCFYLTDKGKVEAAELFDDPDGNGLWIAEEDGEIVGSICIIGKGHGDAQLRLFGIDPSLQGRGAGKMLMQTAMDFCREKDYSHVILWTIDICKAARSLYDRFGFVLTDTKVNTTWADYEMTEEKWEYRN